MTTSAVSKNAPIQLPNQLIPIICVYIIVKSPTILLVGFMLSYFMLIEPKKKIAMIQSISCNSIKMIRQSSTFGSLRSITPPPLDFDCSSDDDEDASITSSNRESMLNDSLEGLLNFPPCPTTLPRLDTHFNFVADEEQLDAVSIDWSAIYQEMEYEQLRQSPPKKKETLISEHPLLRLHQLQQPDAPMFSEYELASLCTPSNQPTYYSPVQDDAAILFVDHQPQVISIEDVLLLPPKLSMPSPNPAFKSKFQKAVDKIKKTSHLVKQDGMNCKRSSIKSHQSSTYVVSPPDFVPIVSTSNRVQEQLRGRINKLFKK